ncbi:hypothetical protein ACFU8X_21110 [Brevibacillus porteri]|uniref:hypothetical protein n=1 Tax=Brevibacillus porteri TaxID=2126350 RepID=UPI00370A9EFA
MTTIGSDNPLKNNPLWVAAYEEYFSSGQSEPISAGGWTSCAIWQYTADGSLTGYANGKKPLDLNRGSELSYLMLPKQPEKLTAQAENGQITLNWCAPNQEAPVTYNV